MKREKSVCGPKKAVKAVLNFFVGCGNLAACRAGRLILLQGVGTVVLVCFLLWAFYPKAKPAHAISVLAAQGYTAIAITGAPFFGCGRGDVYRTSFEATSPSGSHIQGTVCEGLFKGTTLRFD